MYLMKDFICATAMTIILLIWMVVQSEFPYYCILVASLLLVVFSVRSLQEQNHKWFMVIQFVLSEILCLLANGFLPFLLFLECRGTNRKKAQIVYPAVMYIMTALAGRPDNMAILILHAMALLLISGIILGLEVLVERYIDIKSRVAQSVTVTAVNEMYQRQLNQELRLKNYLIDKNARLEERENISRNIHNSVGHSITAAIMTLDAADMLFEQQPEQAREKMRIANGRIHEGLESIRRAVRVLDAENVYVSIQDFIRELQEIIKNFVVDTQIKVRADFPEEAEGPFLPHEHTEFLTGALQELLTNGVKHGNANVFTISVTVDSGHIRLCVANNGSSQNNVESDWYEKGYGLKKIVSYTRKCGGDTQIMNDNGWTTEVTLPFERREDCE